MASIASFFFFVVVQPPISTLFPYTTLFRSPEIFKRHRQPFVDGSKPAELGLDDRYLVDGIHGAETFHLHVQDRKSTRLNSSHGYSSYAVCCLKKNKTDAGVPFRGRPFY